MEYLTLTLEERKGYEHSAYVVEPDELVKGGKLKSECPCKSCLCKKEYKVGSLVTDIVYEPGMFCRGRWFVLNILVMKSKPDFMYSYPSLNKKLTLQKLKYANLAMY
jgi:hypothetical protein